MVSVIIPNYNGEAHLRECVESVLSQGEEYVEQIIVIDDHSTDGSLNIIQDYKNLYPRLFVVEKNHKKGAQSARNLGLTFASGKFIQWLDNDDVLMPGKFQLQIKAMMEDDNGASFCGWKYIGRKLAGDSEIVRSFWTQYDLSAELFISMWLVEGMIPTVCWLVQKDLCVDDGWDESILRNQDGLYFFRSVLGKTGISCVSDTIAGYRYPSASNISGRISREAMRSYLKTLIEYEELINHVETSRSKKALAINYARYLYCLPAEYGELRTSAIERLSNLGFAKPPLIGGGRFKMLQALLGMNRAKWIQGYVKR